MELSNRFNGNDICSFPNPRTFYLYILAIFFSYISISLFETRSLGTFHQIIFLHFVSYYIYFIVSRFEYRSDTLYIYHHGRPRLLLGSSYHKRQLSTTGIYASSVFEIFKYGFITDTISRFFQKSGNTRGSFLRQDYQWRMLSCKFINFLRHREIR